MSKPYLEFLHEIRAFFSDKNNQNKSYEHMFGDSKLEICNESGLYYCKDVESRKLKVEYIAVRFLEYTTEHAPEYPVSFNSWNTQHFRKSDMKNAINCFIHRATSKNPVHASELFLGVSIDDLQNDLLKSNEGI